MNYELCKKLKEAGYNQDGSDFVIYDNGETEYTRDGYFTTGAVACPTLNELIEACGNRFTSPIMEEPKRWKTVENKYFSTLEEAIAALYIALNKK